MNYCVDFILNFVANSYRKKKIWYYKNFATFFHSFHYFHLFFILLLLGIKTDSWSCWQVRDSVRTWRSNLYESRRSQVRTRRHAGHRWTGCESRCVNEIDVKLYSIYFFKLVFNYILITLYCVYTLKYCDHLLIYWLIL